ncbi:hypothetical protein [Enterococcus camelliae]|uniref:Integral membrane protein n=1 Tax=Enterococcus camelliae TaxID=453959 RepID=A0ABW5THB2_9ENTE
MSLRKKWFPFILLLSLSFVLVLPQIVTRNSIIGADYLFHYNRFYETAMQIKHGNFQYFLSIYGFQASGRIVNALYGPLMAYIQGALVLLAGTWFRYQVLSNFLMYWLSGTAMFLLLKKHGRTTSVALPISIVYMTSYCTLYWVFRQSFTSWGAAIFPLALIPLKAFIEEKEIQPIPFALSFALMAQTHLFSSLLVTIIYFLAFCFVLPQKVPWRFFGQLAKASGLFLLLTANIWGAFFSIYRGDTIQAPFVNDQMASYSINQLGKIWVLYPGFLLLLLFVQAILYMVHFKHYSPFFHFVFWVSCFFGMLSTSLLPWNELVADQIPFVSLIQFPFRFSVPFIVLFLYTFAWQMQTMARTKPTSWLLLAVPLCILSIGQTLHETSIKLAEWPQLTLADFEAKHTYLQTDNSQQIRDSFHQKDLHQLLSLVIKSTPDYLPTNPEIPGNRYTIYEKEILFSPTHFTKIVRKNGELTVSWVANQTSPVTLPLVAYRQTRLTLNGQPIQLDTTMQSAIGAITLTQQKGQNHLTLHYQKSLLVRISLWISLFTWLFCLFAWLFNNWLMKRQRVTN